VLRCPDCRGARLAPQSRAVRIKTASPQFADKPE
jgi:hypothetical protein